MKTPRQNQSDCHWIAFVNDTMATINECTDDIYESLADRELEDLNRHLDKLIKELNHLKEGIKDEVE